MNKRFTVYLIGYKPPGWEANREEMERLIRASDFCVQSSFGVQVGEILTIGPTVYPGRDAIKPPVENTRMTVLEVRENGKVVVVETLSASS